MIAFRWYSFDELTTKQLYEVLSLRSEVFVVEQNCVYYDMDEASGEVYQEDCIPHIFMRKKVEI